MSFAMLCKLLQSDAILVLLSLFWQIPDTASAVLLWVWPGGQSPFACQGNHSPQGHVLSGRNVVKPPVLQELMLMLLGHRSK